MYIRGTRPYVKRNQNKHSTKKPFLQREIIKSSTYRFAKPRPISWWYVRSTDTHGTSGIWLSLTPSQLFDFFHFTFSNGCERLLTFCHISQSLFNQLKMCSNHLVKFFIRQDHYMLRCVKCRSARVNTKPYM
jgi:hypothetical protein